MSSTDKKVLASHGWTVECESPFEIRHMDGSRATKQAAKAILSSLLEESIVMKFTQLPLGARFKYLGKYPDITTDGLVSQIWIKLSNEDCGLIAEYDRIYIRHRDWFGQKVCSFADTPEQLDELYVILEEE